MKSSQQSKRIQFLSVQIMRLRKEDESYRKKRFHSPKDVEAHRKREERLYEILGELAFLNRKTKAAGASASSGRTAS